MTKAHQPRQAAIYARVSDDLSGRDKAVSINEQLAACEKLLRENGDRLVATYIDDARYRSEISGQMVQPSAKRPDRPAWKQMLAAAGKDWDVLYAWRVDRICRGNETAGMFERVLDERRFEVVLATQTFDRDTFGLLAGGVSGYELRNIQARMMMGREGRVKSGLYVGRAPYGYKAVRDDLGRNIGAELTPQGRVFLAELARLFVAGETLESMARLLGPNPATGRAWTAPTVRLWLVMPFYRGQLAYGRSRPAGQVVYNERPARHAIVWDAATIAAIDAELARRQMLGPSRHRQRTHDHLLAGVLYCANCRLPLVKHTSRKPGSPIYLSYACHRRRAASIAAGCKPNHISETDAMRYLRAEWATWNEATIDAYLDSRAAPAPLANVAALASRDQLEAEAAELEGDLAHASAAGARLIEARLNEVRADIAARTRITATRAAEAVAVSRATLRAAMLHLASLAAAWDSLSRPDQRAALQGYPPIFVRGGRFVSDDGL